jgi:hypothetical protein
VREIKYVREREREREREKEREKERKWHFCNIKGRGKGRVLHLSLSLSLFPFPILKVFCKTNSNVVSFPRSFLVSSFRFSNTSITSTATTTKTPPYLYFFCGTLNLSRLVSDFRLSRIYTDTTNKHMTSKIISFALMVVLLLNLQVLCGFVVF